jgi:hypothetical protein
VIGFRAADFSLAAAARVASRRAAERAPCRRGTPSALARSRLGGRCLPPFPSPSPLRARSGPDGLWNAVESVYVSLGAARPSGLLLKYDPRNGETTALAGGLWFGNGVALSRGEDFVVVADSIRARLLR